MISRSYSDDYDVLLAGCFMFGFLCGLIIVLEDANDMFLRNVLTFNVLYGNISQQKELFIKQFSSFCT
jgi:hypothetical protein